MNIETWCELYGMEEGYFNPERFEYIVYNKWTKKEYHVPSYIVENGKSFDEKEQVNHPSHYNLPGKKECIEEMVDIYGVQAVCKWCLITAYKYSYRAGEKDGNSREQDIAKIEWYLKWFLNHVKDIKPLELQQYPIHLYSKTLDKIQENIGVVINIKLEEELNDDGNN